MTSAVQFKGNLRRLGAKLTPPIPAGASSCLFEDGVAPFVCARFFRRLRKRLETRLCDTVDSDCGCIFFHTSG